MTHTAMTEADQRIVTAAAAQAERDRLVRRRDALALPLDEARRQAEELSVRLSKEERDVARYESGVWAFLYEVFADRAQRLSKEQQEAAEAAARYHEATALRDRLGNELVALDQRIQELARASDELAAAHRDKELLLLESGGPTADELVRIADQCGRFEDEARAVEEALDAGQRTLVAIGKLADALFSARSWGVVDIWSDSMLISIAKRNKLDEARGLAGAAQAELTVFARELSDVGVHLVSQLTGLADHHRFLDTWFDNIISDISVQSRIEQAMSTTAKTTDQVKKQLVELNASREAIKDRAAELQRVRSTIIADSN